MNEATARQIVRERSGGWCEVGLSNVCLRYMASVHHRRKPGRVWLPSNLLATCGGGTTGCHGWIEAHPAESHKMGWWLMTGDGEPSTVRLWRNAYTDQEGWVLLDDEGMWSWDESGSSQE